MLLSSKSQVACLPSLPSPPSSSPKAVSRGTLNKSEGLCSQASMGVFLPCVAAPWPPRWAKNTAQLGVSYFYFLEQSVCPWQQPPPCGPHQSRLRGLPQPGREGPPTWATGSTACPCARLCSWRRVARGGRPGRCAGLGMPPARLSWAGGGQELHDYTVPRAVIQHGTLRGLGLEELVAPLTGTQSLGWHTCHPGPWMGA